MAKRARVAGHIPSAAPTDFVLRVHLESITPEIWRALRVPGEYTLAQLHRTLQLVFGWQDYHLHEFTIGTRRFEAPGEEAEGESTAIRLADLALVAGDRFLYRYDFGDDWAHVIEVEALESPVDLAEPRWPLLLGGARAGPPEDCGGVVGYAELVTALARPRTKAGQTHRDWVGPTYDPAVFDEWHVGRMLTLAAAYGAL
ncbi:MAG TPA: plasmid pRiA4b ORF-3 family protein [Gemmatimonas sp.]|uniref:plasmid pRiA4b ORF-3 family protein n=1 Tax=Gemmatimonas sp. TaxID=1962908 RepID=UPI002EDB19CE